MEMTNLNYNPHPLAYFANELPLKGAFIGNSERRSLGLFADETEKLDAWADDLKLGLEREMDFFACGWVSA